MQIKGENPETIIQAVCKALNIERKDLTGQRRTGKLREARRIAIGLMLVADSRLRLKEVGKIFSRNHTSVIYNREVFEFQNGFDRDFTKKVNAVMQLF